MTGIPDDYTEDLRNTRRVRDVSTSPFHRIYDSVLLQVWQMLAQRGIESRINLTEVMDVPERPQFWAITVLQTRDDPDVRVRVERMKNMVWACVAVLYCDNNIFEEVHVRWFVSRREGKFHWRLVAVAYA